jgi:hypothetical protein
MVVKLVEVKTRHGKIFLQEIYINPKQVVCIRPSYESLDENLYPDGLDKRQEFSKVHLDHGQNGLALMVVGPPAMIESKLNEANLQLLKG